MVKSISKIITKVFIYASLGYILEGGFLLHRRMMKSTANGLTKVSAWADKKLES